jgi:hypothetical protein
MFKGLWKSVRNLEVDTSFLHEKQPLLPKFEPYVKSLPEGETTELKAIKGLNSGLFRLISDFSNYVQDVNYTWRRIDASYCCHPCPKRYFKIPLPFPHAYLGKGDRAP